MNTGNLIIEQIDSQGNVVPGRDTSLSPREIFNCIRQYFPNIYLNEDHVICGSYNNMDFAIKCKNITYLGTPHPYFKKRIQIADDLQRFYSYSKERNLVPLLLGVYTFQNNTVFCEFHIEDYIGKKAHNSSAHIYSLDISNAVLHGYFEKTDFNNNHITVFQADKVARYLTYRSSHHLPSLQLEISRVVDEFFKSVPLHWDGISCYQEMIAANYRNKFQPEWPGFYLEYLLEKNIEDQRLKGLITYAQDKRAGGVDLDLYFPTLDTYGDLKAHSDTSSAIQGNDWDTVHSLINDPLKKRSLYYIVLEHKTQKDNLYNYEVTNFWNRAQGKSNLLSYAKRMKHHVDLTHYYILEINSNNQQYLTEFKQGKNSDGNPRNPKIMIDNKYLSNFLIYRKDFS